MSPRLCIASQRVVLTRDPGFEIAAACLTVDGPHIVDVTRLDQGSYHQQLGELAQRQPEVRLCDYGERLVSPAFVNGHTHLALAFLRSVDSRTEGSGNLVEDFFFDLERRLTPEDVRAFSRMGAYESLLGGVGLVWDHYYAGDQVAAALQDVGLSGVVAPTLQDLSGPGMHDWQAQLQATLAIADDDRLRERGIFAALGPHASDTVSFELLQRVAGLAAQHQLPVHLHLAQSLAKVQRTHDRHGLSPLGLLDRSGVLSAAPSGVFAHAIFVSRADLAKLSGGPHRLVYCPYSQLIFGYPASVQCWADSDVPWVVGTDCAASNDSMNLQQELRFVAAQRTVGATWSPAQQRFLDSGAVQDAAAAWNQRSKLFAAHQALAEPSGLLARVWSQPGAMHPAFRTGVLSVGALANIAVWDLEHPSLWPAVDPLRTLVMANAAPALWALYVAGRAIGQDGNVSGSVLSSDDYRGARREASDRLRQLLASS